ncbi:PREDICTED: uncharacterized protein LOC104597923 isoform X2 [Nelumbo nucifera]|uniref:Mitochondrial import inner membrane translocase subunit TIM50 n=1 Tax=Nelumbo nucifera TaxID=4432 RepID=A0A1U8A7V5_NELNU|nr:PREDICTED: uncharacterized protein LOC104597923 isoform X2 [Nelumbo nucifera]
MASSTNNEEAYKEMKDREIDTEKERNGKQTQDENLEVSEKEGTPLNLTQKSPTNGHFNEAVQIKERHPAVRPKQKKRERIKKNKSTAPKTDSSLSPQENDALCSRDLTNTKHLEKEQKLHIKTDLLPEELTILTDTADTNSGKYNKPDESQKRLKTYKRRKTFRTYRRKNKMLFASLLNYMEQAMEKSPNSTIHGIQNSSVGELSSNELDNTCMEENEEAVNELDKAMETYHIFNEEKLEASTTECTMEQTIPSSSNVDVVEHLVLVDGTNTEESSMEILPSKRVPISHVKRKLLILDLNGLLADIVNFVPDGYKPDKKVSRKALFKRPFCDDFLEFCFGGFDVAVWSSRIKKNVDTVVDFLMGEMKHRLLFCWDQSHCTETGFNTIENKHKPLVLKELRKLWDKYDPHLPWEKGEYNESNTLLLDDSPYKALRNPPYTAIFPNTYRFQDTEDNSLGPGGDLRVYLEGLAMAEDVQQYVKHHPFGQCPITNTNSYWPFYLEIMGAAPQHVIYQYQPDDNSSFLSIPSSSVACGCGG